MKLYAIITLILFLSMLFIPLFSLLGENTNQSDRIVLTTSSAASQKETETTVSAQTTVSAAEEKETISVMLTSSDKIKNMDMSSYVAGCLAAEMPASYETEALKAQAVASYTYALYMKSNNTDGKSDISDNPSVHQAYLSNDELKKKWGSNYEKYMAVIHKAVEETEGEYLTYDSALIKPAYHALSSGMTNSAADVWGGEIPWLISVNSVSDKLSPTCITSFEFSSKELVSLLGNKKIDKITIGDTVTASSGYVKSITISGVEFTGEELRSLLSLRSGSFTVETARDTYKFTCYGYGHGVGMSQYGANEMARQGYTYKEILQHYYPGTEISSD